MKMKQYALCFVFILVDNLAVSRRNPSSFLKNNEHFLLSFMLWNSTKFLSYKKDLNMFNIIIHSPVDGY